MLKKNKIPQLRILKTKRSKIFDTLEVDENDWVSPVATPVKPRRKPAAAGLKTHDIPLVQARINGMTPGRKADDSFELDFLAADQSLDSPLPQTPPRRIGPFDTPYIHGSPFCLSDFSSPTITYAFIRSDIPSPIPSSLMDNWLGEPSMVREDLNGKRQNQDDVETSTFRLGPRTTSTSSLDSASDSISSTDSISGGVAIYCLDGSSISCSRPSTPTPTHA
ncbi:hypothetical protein VNI00_009604 [Paramarasmius palmivorus]|uniref:Uncharacterized protein n=1 Tax=Paramarasmius palmivorus TaxID=297713 RepID=A0AAW0CRI5_9AGAR